MRTDHACMIRSRRGTSRRPCRTLMGIRCSTRMSPWTNPWMGRFCSGGDRMHRSTVHVLVHNCPGVIVQTVARRDVGGRDSGVSTPLGCPGSRKLRPRQPGGQDAKRTTAAPGFRCQGTPVPPRWFRNLAGLSANGHLGPLIRGLKCPFALSLRSIDAG
jgi:hypothetical protein